MGQTTLNWQYDGPDPESFSVYRSATPMDPGALPSPLATAISGALRSYVDSTVVEGNTYYYRVSALKGTVEKVSDEIKHVAEVIGDPSWLAVKSLLNFEGADGGTTFTDEVAGTTWGSPNLATTSTERARFGTASYKGASNTDSRIQVTGGGQLIPTNLTFFTIECWVYLTAYAPAGTAGSAIFSQQCSGGHCEQFFGIQPTGDGDGKLTFRRASAHGNPVSVFSPSAVPLNQWVHVAVSFDGQYIRLFMDGVKVATSAATTGWVNPGSAQYFGHQIVTGYPQYRGSLCGYVDGFRLTTDCRYINDFVPPTTAAPTQDRVVTFEDTYDTDLLSTAYIRVEDTPGTMSVSGGALTIATTSANQSKLSPQGVYFADGYIEADLARADDGGLVVRMRGRDNYYVAVVCDGSASASANTAVLYKKVNGTYTQIGSRVALPTSWTRGTSQTFRFEVSGTTLTLKQNGTPVITATDSTHAHGRVAVRGNGNGQTVCQRLKAVG